MERQCVRKILDQAVAAVHAQFLICTIGYRNKDMMRNQGIGLFVCVQLLKNYSLDNGIIDNDQQERSVS